MVFDRQVTTTSAADTQALAGELAVGLLRSADSGPVVLCLYGQLGAGKSTFVRGLAGGFGIKERILSPTFVLVRTYGIPGTDYRLHHLDLYRLENHQAQHDSGIREILEEEKAYVAVEWADKLGICIPEKRWDIRCSVHGEGHGIHIKRVGYG
jgi:tRNA threonylcarbamoyladenosine biosynthesis protein TsaE